MTEKRYFVKFLCLFLTGVMFLCAGCSGDVAETEKSGTVRFISGGAESSREMFVSDTVDCDADSLYWAYVAVKKDGLHTTGESEKTDSAVTGVSVEAESGKYYKLRPVKSPLRGFADKGLDADVGSFAYGDWLFKIYGYSSYDSAAKTFSGLMYTGDTIGLTRVNSDTNSVGFKMATTTNYPADGNLAFGSLYFTVPQNMKLYKNSKVTVTFTEGASNTIATATGTVGSSDAAAGTKIWLSVGSISSTTEGKGKDGKFAPGTYYFSIEIKYTKSSGTTGDVDDEITTSTLKSFPVIFNAGITTLLYGNVNDINVDNGVGSDSGVTGNPTQHPNTDFGIVVATTGSGASLVEYTSLADAIKAAKTPVTLIRDIEYGGSIKPLAATTINLNGHFIRNLAIESGSYALTFSPGSGTYAFTSAGGKVNNLSYSGNTVWLDTTGGAITINSASGNVYHTGTASTVTVTACANDKVNNAGYHCSAYVGSLSVTKGFIDICGFTVIETLSSVGSYANVTMRGTSTSKINNLDEYIFRNYSTIKGTATQNTFMPITLNGNGATKSSTDTSFEDGIFYGVEGMYVNLPLFVDNNDAHSSYPYYKKALLGYPGKAFTGWNSSRVGTGTAYGDGSQFLVADKGNVVFAQWENALPVGGRIFYIRPTDGLDSSGPTGCPTGTASTPIDCNSNGSISISGYTYTFYDKDGRVVNLGGKVYKRNADHSLANEGRDVIDTLQDAVYYYMPSTPTSGYVDRFYVYDYTNGMIGCDSGSTGDTGVATGGYNIGSNFNTANSPWKELARNGIGNGKAVYNALFATKGTAGGAFDIMCQAASGKYLTFTGYSNYLNGYTDYNNSSYFWNSCTRKPGGCNDWFVGSPLEIDMLGDYLKVVKMVARYNFGTYGRKITPPSYDDAKIQQIVTTFFNQWVKSSSKFASDGTTWYRPGNNGEFGTSVSWFYTNCAAIGMRSF